MAQRGTLNYLINGGALSLFRKAAHLMRMRREVAGAETRAILDTIASTITARIGA